MVRGFLQLGDDSVDNVLGYLEVEDLRSLGCVSKLFVSKCKKVLWKKINILPQQNSECALVYLHADLEDDEEIPQDADWTQLEYVQDLGVQVCCSSHCESIMNAMLQGAKSNRFISPLLPDCILRIFGFTMLR
jgi:hypothetical protein